MNVLGFDTCFGACSVAVRWRSRRGEWLLREAYEERLAQHADVLLPMAQAVMEGAGLRFDQLDRIAVTLGPGTFTGVRTGVAAAQGLSIAAGLPVVGMSSLAVMAFRADTLPAIKRDARRTTVAVDARKGQIYVQHFGGDCGEVLSEATLATPDAAALASGDQPLLAVGSGAHALGAARSALGWQTDIALTTLQPHARHLVLLSRALKPLERVRPLYMRAPDAKPAAASALPRTR